MSKAEGRPAIRTEKLPLLPRAAVDEHNLQGGRLLYTPSQMRAYGLACYQQAIEDAAKLCKEEEDRFWRAYKGHGEPSEKGNPHTEGASDQCAVLADAIRRLKDTL